MFRPTAMMGPTGYVQFLKGRRCSRFWRRMAARKRREAMPMQTQEIWLETPTMLVYIVRTWFGRWLICERGLLLQPCPELAGSDVAGSEAEAADEGCGQDGDPGDLEAVEVAEEAGGVAVYREGVEKPGPGE
jgi:hypothetical protein